MNIHKVKQLGKWLSRQVTWFLVLAFVVNLVGTFVAPKVAHAADPKMFLFWAGTCSSPPVGWTDETAAGKAFAKGAYGGIFPRGNSAYAVNNGSMGAESHTHTFGGSQTATSGTQRVGGAGTGYSSYAHSHPITGSVNSVSSLPAYKDICVISYPGVPTTIPQNAIAIFDTASIPADWQDYSATFGTNYLRANTVAGGTGGSNTHQATGHTISAITLNQSPNEVTKSGTTGSRSSLNTHTHTVANQTSDTPNTEPQYITVNLFQATANTSIPSHMIAMFDGSGFISHGWEVVSDVGGDFYQRFPKVTGTYGTKSGANFHHHADITGLTSSTSTASTGGTGSGGIQAHSHTVTVTEADGTTTNIPPYTDVIFAKRSYVYTSLTTDSGSYPNQGDTITLNSQVDNHSLTALANTKLDYVFFIDANADHDPDAGETYIYKTASDCDTSGAWAAGNYTFQTTGVNVASEANATDSKNCTNTNFPSNTTYTLWSQWYDNAGTVIYDTNYTTFTSVPTLTEILFMALVGCAVFLGVRTGAIKFKIKKPDDNLDNNPPTPHHEQERSNDGITYIERRDKR